jgi:hypothetical protein
MVTVASGATTARGIQYLLMLAHLRISCSALDALQAQPPPMGSRAHVSFQQQGQCSIFQPAATSHKAAALRIKHYCGGTFCRMLRQQVVAVIGFMEYYKRGIVVFHTLTSCISEQMKSLTSELVDTELPISLCCCCMQRRPAFPQIPGVPTLKEHHLAPPSCVLPDSTSHAPAISL